MNELVFYLDGKGILAKDSDSESDYILNGSPIIELSLSDDFLKKTNELLSYEYKKFKYAKLNEKIIKKFDKKFHCDMSWVASFKVIIFPVSGRRLDVHYKYNNRELIIPIVTRDYLFSTNKTFLHELIHVVRSNVVYPGSDAFEEAYANKFEWIRIIQDNCSPIDMLKNRFKIRESEKKLDDVVGDYKEYVSIRLKEKETAHIAYTPKLDVKNYLKSQKKLRHKIMIEKLDL